jgi:hypothetical protein
VGVTNTGPHAARNVAVNVRITPYIGLDFVYPGDWTLTDAMHVNPAPIATVFPSIPAGNTQIAKFSVSAAQVEDLWGWESAQLWHPCLLASVTADNDYAFANATFTGNSVMRRNNFAQRNLTVVDVTAGATVSLPFLVGNILKQETEISELVIEQRRVSKPAKLVLSFAEPEEFFHAGEFGLGDNDMVFLDRTRVATTLNAARSVLMLERGSRLMLPSTPGITVVNVKGAETVIRKGKMAFEIHEPKAVVRFEKRGGRTVRLALRTTIPAGAARRDQFLIRLFLRGPRRETAGGAGVLYRVK